jgi:hypothetical protein
MLARTLVRFVSPDARHEGVRPIQLWGLRLFFLLMLVLVTPTAWNVLLTHQGPWDPLRGIAFAVWATYPALAVFGLIQPLRWLPLMFFTLGYKAIWLAFIAYPLWQAGTLWGTPTGEIAGSFLALPLLAAVVPWGYARRSFFSWPRQELQTGPNAPVVAS